MKAHVTKGSTVIVVWRKRSASGMTRYYDLYSTSTDKRFPLLRWSVIASDLTGHRYDRKNEAIAVKGCGFSGAHEIVSNLAEALYQDCQALEFQEL